MYIKDFIEHYILETGLVFILRLKTKFEIYSLRPDSSKETVAISVHFFMRITYVCVAVCGFII
jgi:hypothetical protein